MVLSAELDCNAYESLWNTVGGSGSLCQFSVTNSSETIIPRSYYGDGDDCGDDVRLLVCSSLVTILRQVSRQF